MSNRPHRKPAGTRAQQRAIEAETSTRRNRLLLMGGGVVIVLFALVIAFAVGSGDDDAEPKAAIEFNGPSLPLYSNTASDPAVGERAPLFVTEDFDGQRHVVGSGGGPNDPARIVAFFAHWCPVCQAELPRLAAQLANTPLPDMVEVHAVSTFEDPSRGNYPPSAWFDEVSWPFPAFSDPDGDIAGAFGMNPVPSWVVLDTFNRVIVRVDGALSDAQFQELVDLAAQSVS